MVVMRWTNIICGALLVVAALGFIIFLPDNVADYAREPEDVWLGVFWIGLLGLLATLCFANAWRTNEQPLAGWLVSANLVVVTLLAMLLVVGRDDPAVLPLLALCALGPVVALVGAWRHRRVQRP
jgi:hypothetical protein